MSGAKMTSAAAPAQFSDDRSEAGDMYEISEVLPSESVGFQSAQSRLPPGERKGIPAAGVTRSAPAVARSFGRGVVPFDPRKHRFDVNAARAAGPIAFSASKADRMDAVEAGDVMNKIHRILQIDREPEEYLLAFNNALFFQHTLNGASEMQSGQGSLSVGGSQFDIGLIIPMFGGNQRKFFRAYADEVADVNREIIAAYDPYDPVSAEKYGQLMQVAFERGLQKFPHLAHDSSDAGVRVTAEERVALMASKRLVLEAIVNKVDVVHQRVDEKKVSSAK